MIKCPTCKRLVEWSEQSPFRPFCSDRCRLVDLGGWLTEQHRIPDPEAGPAPEGADLTDD